MKSTLFLSLVYLSTAASAATISNLSVRQRWPFSQKVDIDFSLEADTAQRISVELYSGETKLNVPEGAFFGGTFVAPGGVRTIVFDPLKTAYTNQVLTGLRFVLTPSEAPLYMIVDLTKSAGENGQVVYLTAYDITNSASSYGTYEANPYWISNSVMQKLGGSTVCWTGVTNNTDYATSKLVLRAIPSGTYSLGYASSSRNPLHSVVLTKSYWMGIYELTQAQWRNITGSSWSCGFTGDRLPLEHVSYTDLRGVFTNSEGSVTAYDWPLGREVAKDSFFGKFRTKTGLDFDLPTHAQWEAAARAGAVNCGVYDGSTSAANTATIPLAWLARYGYNLNVYGAPLGNRTAYVGCFLPNAWGLYDVLGNVREIVRDWRGNAFTTATLTDPEGDNSDSSNYRKWLGGAYSQSATGGCILYGESSDGGADVRKGPDTGFRVYLPAQ